MLYNALSRVLMNISKTAAKKIQLLSNGLIKHKILALFIGSVNIG